MAALSNLVFLVVTKWLPECQAAQWSYNNVQRRRERMPLPDVSSERKSSWPPHSLGLLQSPLQDYLPSALLNQALAKDWTLMLASKPHVVGVEGVEIKRQTKPRLCSNEEDGLAAQTANTSTPEASFTPCPDFPFFGVTSIPWKGSGFML